MVLAVDNKIMAEGTLDQLFVLSIKLQFDGVTRDRIRITWKDLV